MAPLCELRRVHNLWLFMSLPTFFFGRVSDDIRQQMDGILALTDQLSRQRLMAIRIEAPCCAVQCD